MMSIHPLQLGATLYVPATRPDLIAILLENKIPDLKSVVLCLEDAISEHDVDFALQQLKHVLATLKQQRTIKSPLIFIRPRHHHMLEQLLAWQDIDAIEGFVLPKFDLDCFTAYQTALQHAPQFYYMPTLETAQIFDLLAQRELCQALKTLPSILALRVGGNDLLNVLSLRRPITTTIYETPVGILMGQLCGQFLSHGFALTAPVFEHFSQMDLFQQELSRDVQYGFSGKTIIHPNQIPAVHHAFKVSQNEFKQARAILAEDAKAVFAENGSMLEPATHRNWAKRIQIRAEMYGLFD